MGTFLLRLQVAEGTLSEELTIKVIGQNLHTNHGKI
jgi:hypothetical protein